MGETWVRNGIRRSKWGLSIYYSNSVVSTRRRLWFPIVMFSISIRSRHSSKPSGFKWGRKSVAGTNQISGIEYRDMMTYKFDWRNEGGSIRQMPALFAYHVDLDFDKFPETVNYVSLYLFQYPVSLNQCYQCRYTCEMITYMHADNPCLTSLTY